MSKQIVIAWLSALLVISCTPKKKVINSFGEMSGNSKTCNITGLILNKGIKECNDSCYIVIKLISVKDCGATFNPLLNGGDTITALAPLIKSIPKKSKVSGLLESRMQPGDTFLFTLHNPTFK